jgi:DNA polymerase I
MNVPELKIFLAHNKEPIAVSAPLVLQDTTLIGLYTSVGDSYCAEMPTSGLKQIGELPYQPKDYPIIVHGLKRIWEFLGFNNTDELDLKLVTDTKLLAYLLEPDAGETEGLTLTHLAYQYLEEEYPHVAREAQDKGVIKAFRESLRRDAQVIWSLGKELPQRMTKDLLKLYHHLELPLMLILDRMRRLGLGVDGTTAQKERIRISKEISELEHRITNGDKINLMSPSEVFLLLMKRGVRFKSEFVYAIRMATTPAMEEIAHVYPAVQDILDWRSMVTDLAFLNKASGHNRIHPVWQQTRAGTSRIYARDPAVQNVSRALREKIMVPAPGKVLIKADYSQAQLRILAHLSGDSALIDLYQRGGDAHAETAKLLGIDRDAAKEVNFGICFGISPTGLCGKVNAVIAKKNRVLTPEEYQDMIDEETAQAYIDSFYSRYTGVQDFFEKEWKKLKALPIERRSVKSLLGRIRRFDTRANPAIQRSFRVTWPQQIEADLIKTAMVRLDWILRRRNMKAQIVMVIHDALWVEAPHAEVEQVRHLLRKMMTTAARLRVPLEVDCKD